jgi:hypothetical protein
MQTYRWTKNKKKHTKVQGKTKNKKYKDKIKKLKIKNTINYVCRKQNANI